MKVLFIIYRLSGGGAERVAVNLMNWLSVDHQVTVCLLNPRDYGQEYPLSDRVSVVEVPLYDAKSMAERFYKQMRDVQRIKREGNYDVALSFLEQGNFMNAVTRGALGPNTVISIRNLASRKNQLIPIGRRKRLQMKLQGAMADRVVCVSQDVAIDQVGCFGVDPRKVRVINNWIDADAVRAQAEEPIDDPAFEAFAQAHPFLFVNSGRLNVQKGQWHLIRAFGELHRSHPETGLVILGEGRSTTDLTQRLQDVIRENGLEDCVLLAGRKKNPFAYMKCAQVFVLSSLFEGFSNAILEAMALGLPVIADDCAGVRECLTPGRAWGDTSEGIIWGEYGVVTPLLSDEWPAGELDVQERALYQAMDQLYEHEDLREAYATMDLVCVRRYEPEVIAKQWLDVLSEGVGARKAVRDVATDVRFVASENVKGVLQNDKERRGIRYADVRAFRKIAALVPETELYKEVAVVPRVKSAGQKRGFLTMRAYYEALLTDEKEVAHLRENLTFTGTHFFRGRDWEYFNTKCLSTFAGAEKVRVWCAGCSSGEEAYSLLASLLDYVDVDKVDILATDYSDAMLAKCNAANYANLHWKEVPEKYRYCFDLGERRFAVKPELRGAVHTQNLNLLLDDYPAPFDIISCRNVMKFFARDKIVEVQRKLAASLAPGGFLFVSTDDNHRGQELVEDPRALGLTRLDDRGIYVKDLE